MGYVPILTLRDGDKVRVIVAALRAHGFHPLEGGELPGLPGITGPNGIAISVPEEESEDAAILAEALHRDMQP